MILDINGEYAEAFGKTRSADRELNQVYIDATPFYLPLWMFNLSELEQFFEASDRSQRPVLERVITTLRESALDEGPAKLTRRFVATIDLCLENLDNLATQLSKPTDAYAGQKALNLLSHIAAAQAEITAAPPTGVPLAPGIETILATAGLKIAEHNIPPPAVTTTRSFIDTLRAGLGQLRAATILKTNLRQITADSPVQFNTRELLRDEAFQTVIARFRGQERIQEYLATLRLRIHRQLADKRWGVFTAESKGQFYEVFRRILGGSVGRVVVIDCSMLAHDVLPFFCAVLGRLLLELRQRAKPSLRMVQPFVLVLEEAHNYLKPRRDDESYGVRLSREAFERIAKEGRKFGLSLIIASQRPSDVSATVLSQCANFLVHRIQNPEDIDYFKKILPTGSRDLLDQLPILSPGDGLLLGSAVNVPVRVKIHKPNPTPASDTPRPWNAWKAGQPIFDVTEVTKAWVEDTDTPAPATEQTAIVKSDKPQ